MKEVKSFLKKSFTSDSKSGIIKADWEENEHPRDDDGQFTDGGEKASNSKEGEIIASYIANPKALGATTPKEKYDSFVKNGIKVKPLNRGSLKGREFADGGGFRINDGKDGILQYHPEKNSHHGGAYYKLSNGDKGTKWYDINGNPKLHIKKATEGSVIDVVENQDKFFEGLEGFEKKEYKEPGCVEVTCFKGTDGGFYRIGAFSNVYVTEFAENEYEAKHNMFEDADLYDDSLPEDELIAAIQADLKKYISE